MSKPKRKARSEAASPSTALHQLPECAQVPPGAGPSLLAGESLHIDSEDSHGGAPGLGLGE